ncbi:hypothetical protein M422DRAFT_245777 [Sphaerobolus stellatus SS14]|nr:hypothetical protein M422DRAFT_245777 [Sphaerobolus stellatus SS14]
MSTSVATFRNRQILGSMISTKFAELEKQRLAYIETFNKILKDAEAPVDDPIGKIEILLEVVCAWNGSGAVVSVRPDYTEKIENFSLDNLDFSLLAAIGLQ